MGLGPRCRSKTKAEITEQIMHVEKDIERHQANIADESLWLRAARARVKELEIKRDMALS